MLPPPRAALPGFAERKPSEIPLDAGFLSPQCLRQFPLSSSTKPRRAPRSFGEVRYDP